MNFEMNKEHLFSYEFDILGNIDATKFYLQITFPKHSHGYKRLKIPLTEGFIETLTNHGVGWTPDNLATIEYHAKQKGLV
jgi:hypothetical protein